MGRLQTTNLKCKYVQQYLFSAFVLAGVTVQFAGREFVPVGDCVADLRYRFNIFPQNNTLQHRSFGHGQLLCFLRRQRDVMIGRFMVA